MSRMPAPDYYTELLDSADTDIGVLAPSVYTDALPRPIGWLRSKLIGRLPDESHLLARHQARMRRRLGRAGDIFFVYTSMLGTHSFFLVFLPLTFWLGAPRNGRGLVAVTALGCWICSWVKDLLCLPRPFAPPMRRLAIGTHHLEYGFPSTHTTNCVSMALYGWLLLYDRMQAALEPDSSLPLIPNCVPIVLGLGLILYAGSVSYGRLYAGMHSLMDVSGGALLGAIVIPLQRTLQPWLEPYLTQSTWLVPLLINAVILGLISIHPQPVDDCPCFEDAVAFMAVLAGVNCGRWIGYNLGWQVLHDDPLTMQVKMDLFLSRTSYRLTWGQGPLQSLIERVLDLPKHVLNPLLGIPPEPGQAWANRASVLVPLTVVVWGTLHMILTRMVVKALSRVILPRLLLVAQRTTSGLAMLPRRHYTPASEYGGHVPPRPISPTPSIIDDWEWRAPTPALGPGSVPGTKTSSRVVSPSPLSQPPLGPQSESESEEGQAPPTTTTTTTTQPESLLPDPWVAQGLRSRTHNPTSTPKAGISAEPESIRDPPAPNLVNENPVLHYDADVLIKYSTYFWIGVHGAMVVPTLFQRFGWLPIA